MNFIRHGKEKHDGNRGQQFKFETHFICIHRAHSEQSQNGIYEKMRAFAHDGLRAADKQHLLILVHTVKIPNEYSCQASDKFPTHF